MLQEPGTTTPAPTRTFFKAPLDATTTEQPEPSGQSTEQPLEKESQPEPNDHRNDPKRFEYWQSQAAKAQNQLKELSAQLDQYKGAPKEALELAQTLYKRPELIEILQKAQSGQLQAPAPAKSAKERYAEMKRPQAPVKPEGYDEYEAQNDPESESYKFRQQYSEYRESLNDYLLQREELRDQMEVEVAKEREQAERVRAQHEELAQELEHKHGLSQPEIGEFFQLFSQEPSTELLVQMFRGVKAGKKPAPPAPAPRPPFQGSPRQEPAGGNQQSGFFGSR